MKFLLLLQALVITVVASAKSQLIFKMSVDEAKPYGIHPYEISEETSEVQRSQFTVSSKEAGIFFTIIDSSTNGSRQLKKALQKSQSFNLENQTLLFQVGVFLANAQSFEETMTSRFDNFDVEIQRIKTQVQRLNGKVPSVVYEKMSAIHQLFNSSAADTDNASLLEAYEYILALSLSKTADTSLNGIFEVENLYASLERTQKTLETLILDLQKNQSDLIEFVKKVEMNDVLSQDLKIREATFFLRANAQNLHSYIGYTNQRILNLQSVKAQFPQLNFDIINKARELKSLAFEIRQKILGAQSELNAIDERYDIFYSASGEMLSSTTHKQMSDVMSLTQNNQKTYLCENRICSPLALHNLEKNTSFSYAVSNGHHLVINRHNLDAIILDRKKLSDLAKTLQCSSGMHKASLGVDYVVQALQVAGWMIVGGVGDSATNLYRMSQSQPANYDFTKRKMQESASEFNAADVAYRNIQARRLNALNEFVSSFQAPLEELTTNSIWSESLTQGSTHQCD